MATLTALELADMRKRLEAEWTTPIDFSKSICNAAFQAIEDAEEDSTFKANSSSDIDAAASPKSFTNPEKKLMRKMWCYHKHGVGG